MLLFCDKSSKRNQNNRYLCTKINLNLISGDMKKWISYLLLIVFTMSASTCIAQSKAEKRELIKAQIMRRVEARRFKINITEIKASRQNSGAVDASLEIIDSLCVSYLPYFGQIHGAILNSSEQGLSFEAPTEGYISSIIYDGTAKILFNVKRNQDEFVYYLVISPKGKADLTVYEKSNRRSPASYSGEIELP